jgi:hypothetical protein
MREIPMPDNDTNEAKHTPGPWRLAIDRDCVEIFGGPSEEFVCALYGEPRGNEEQEREYKRQAIADGQFMIAAPDLLAACKAAVHAFADGSAFPWKIVRAAIAKATNEGSSND